MSGALRRLRAHPLHPVLLGGLALVAAVLVSGLPRASNRLADDALAHDIATAPYAARDIVMEQRVRPSQSGADLAGSAASLDRFAGMLPTPLPRLTHQRWFAASVDTGTIVPSGPKTNLQVRHQSGVQQAAQLAGGRWPANRAAAPTIRAAPVEIALSTQVARLAGVNVGRVLQLNTGDPLTFQAVVVGLFTPTDPTAPVWDQMPLAVQATWPLPDEPLRAAAVTDLVGAATLARRFDQVTYTWRYRIDERALDGQQVDAVSAAVTRSRQLLLGDRFVVITALDTLLEQYARQVRGVRSLLGIVQAGLLATLLGLAALAALLAVQRRRDEYTLLRARGGTVATVGRRAAAESLLTVPLAVLTGWLLGTLVPGRPAADGWLPIAVLGTVAVATTPVLAMLAQRGTTVVGQRRDLVRHRPTARRATAELSVVLLAAAGAYLLNRRGLSDTGVDAYLVSVPVLLAAAAAVVALRVLPWPVRHAGRLAARARGVVPFLGLAHAGRGSPISTGPLAVLVVAIATGAFSGAVTASIDDARDRATTSQVPADAALGGAYFTRDTADRLAALPGVTAVTAQAVEPGPIRSARGPVEQAQAIVVDAPSFARVIDDSGVEADLPAALRNAVATPGAPVPAVVSPTVADELRRAAPDGAPPAGTVTVRSRAYDFTVGAVVDRFPGVAPGTTRFVILPGQALPGAALHPNRFLVAGAGLDPAVLRQVGDDGQRSFAGTVLGQPVPTLPRPTQVTTWAGHRAGLESTGANAVLTLAFLTGVAGATVLALFAVVLGVLAGAHTRGRVLSRLRTMGLSPRQGRSLLLVELVPMVGLAVLTGVLVGTLMPLLLRPALGLDAFTAGVGTRARLDPLLAAGVPVLILLALVTAVAVENLTNRRLRLGELLRLGEES